MKRRHTIDLLKILFLLSESSGINFHHPSEILCGTQGHKYNSLEFEVALMSYYQITHAAV